MKKFISILSVTIIAAILMSSCKSGIAPQPIASYDTIGLAAFQNWKLQQYQEAMYATNEAAVAPVTPSVAAPRTKVVYRKARPNYSSGSMNTASTHAAKTTTPATKRGWSKAAKGAVIGGAGGAVLGAVIHKRNRVVGGVVGGVLGGGIGYGIGRAKDKRDGRYYN